MVQPAESPDTTIGLDARCLQDDSAFRGVARHVTGLLHGMVNLLPNTLQIYLLLDRDKPRNGIMGSFAHSSKSRGNNEDDTPLLDTLYPSLLIDDWSVLGTDRKPKLDLIHIPAQY